MSFDNQKFID